MKNTASTYSNPLEKFEEAALELALYENALEEAKEYSEETPESKAWYEASFSRIMKLIEDETRKAHRHAASKQTIMRLIEVAAVVVLVVAIAGSIAIAASGTVRARIVEFLMEDTPRYTEIGFVKSTEFIEVPEEWTGEYYPSYIPEQISTTIVTQNHSTQIVTFTNDLGEFISFWIASIDISTRVDTEGATATPLIVNGHVATLFDKEGYHVLIWQERDHYFILDTNYSREELLAIADSIVLISR